MIVEDCGAYPVRSGGAILIYKAYPTIMYNRFMNNGLSNDTGGNNPTNIETANGGAIGHYSSEDVELMRTGTIQEETVIQAETYRKS